MTYKFPLLPPHVYLQTSIYEYSGLKFLWVLFFPIRPHTLAFLCQGNKPSSSVSILQSICEVKWINYLSLLNLTFLAHILPYRCLKCEDKQTSSLMKSKTFQAVLQQVLDKFNKWTVDVTDERYYTWTRVLCRTVSNTIWEQIIFYARSVLLAAVLGIVWIKNSA